MYVYRRPHDYRAARFNQRIIFGALYADVPVSVYRLPPKLIRSDGVYRQNYSVVPGATFYPIAPQGMGGSTSLSFTCSATPQGVFDSASSLILYFERTRKERAAWSRPPESGDALRSLSAQFTSWQPTGRASLTFTASGSLTAASLIAGSTTLSFGASAALSSTAVLRGATTLSFLATAVTGGETLIAGSTTLSFTGTGRLASGLNGSTTLTFTASATVRGLAAIRGAASLTFSVGPATIVTYEPVDVLVRAYRRGHFGGLYRYVGDEFYIDSPLEYSPYWMTLLDTPPADWLPLLPVYVPYIDRYIYRPMTQADAIAWIADGVR